MRPTTALSARRCTKAAGECAAQPLQQTDLEREAFVLTGYKKNRRNAARLKSNEGWRPELPSSLAKAQPAPK
jgi:hypothetical protein